MRLDAGRDVWQECHITSTLNGTGDHALFLSRSAIALAALELTVAAQKFLERFGVFIVDISLSFFGRTSDLGFGFVEGLKLFFLAIHYSVAPVTKIELSNIERKTGKSKSVRRYLRNRSSSAWAGMLNAVKFPICDCEKPAGIDIRRQFA